MIGETFKSRNARVSIEQNGVRIKRRWFFGGGEKLIPYSKITAIQFKEPGILAGYLQLEVSGQGTSVRYGNLGNAARDENTIFFGWGTDQWMRVRDYIESRIMPSA